MRDSPASRPIALPLERAGASPAGEAGLSELLTAGLSAVSLPRVMQAIGRWWGTHFAAERIVIAVRDECWRGLAVTHSDGVSPLETRWLEDCAATGSMSIRELLTQRIGSLENAHWFPFGDAGQLFGGLLTVPPTATAFAPPPALWLDATARLLAAARVQESRLLREKLDSMAEFAAGAGHEINNPLGSILGRVQLLAKDESHAERRRMLSTIGAQALRIRDMIGDAMLFARPPAPQPTEQNLTAAVHEVVTRFAEDAKRRGLRMETTGPSAVLLWADGVQLRIVISELLRNALHAAPDDSVVELRTGRVATPHGECGQLEIADCGPGLTETEMRHLFDPFFSGRQAGRGLGFGLSKCWRIVTQHGGCLHPRNQRPGMCMTVHWPMRQAR